MSDSVIKVENVSKACRLGQIGGGTLKEDVSRWWARLRGQPDPTPAPEGPKL
jgi:lipopolysaccharide transport system ATP-binding protein